MAKKQFDSELAKKILLTISATIAVAGLASVLVAIPGLGRVAKELFDWYQSQNKGRRFRIRKTFEELRRARLIKEESLPNGATRLVLSDSGRKHVLQYKFEDLKITPLKAWDKKWRLVIFDLPKRYRQERDLFRDKLKLLGFYQLQKSVWLHPWPCRHEIDFITEYLKIGPYVRMVEASNFDGSAEIKTHFF